MGTSQRVRSPLETLRGGRTNDAPPLLRPIRGLGFGIFSLECDANRGSPPPSIYDGEAKILCRGGPEPGTLIRISRTNITSVTTPEARHDQRQGLHQQPHFRAVSLTSLAAIGGSRRLIRRHSTCASKLILRQVEIVQSRSSSATSPRARCRAPWHRGGRPAALSRTIIEDDVRGRRVADPMIAGPAYRLLRWAQRTR